MAEPETCPEFPPIETESGPQPIPDSEKEDPGIIRDVLQPKETKLCQTQ